MGRLLDPCRHPSGEPTRATLGLLVAREALDAATLAPPDVLVRLTFEADRAMAAAPLPGCRAPARLLSRLPSQQGRQVDDRDRLLGSGTKVAKLDLPLGQLVADDDREASAFPDGCLELAPELPGHQLGADGEALSAQVGREAEALSRGRRIGTDDDGQRHRRRVA
jgi:hypothetical protein